MEMGSGAYIDGCSSPLVAGQAATIEKIVIYVKVKITISRVPAWIIPVHAQGSGERKWNLSS